MSQIQKSKELSFRKAKVEDAPSISALVNSAYRGESSRNGWTTEADFLSGQRTDAEAIAEIITQESQCILLCEQQNRLIGSVQLEKIDSNVCYFGMFAIDPQLQARGLGKIFIQECERFAKEEWHCHTMEMTVITIRKELIEWYERRGYQRTGEIRPFPYGNERFGIPLRPDIELGVLRKRLLF